MKMRRHYRTVALLAVLSVMLPGTVLAASITWKFNGSALPVVPSDYSLAGTAADWTLEANPNNVGPTEQAVDFTGTSIFFLDDANLAGNLGLRTPSNAALRENYRLSGPGDQLFFICDLQMYEYGERSNLTAGSVDNTRCQVCWISFETSSGQKIGLQYNAGNYNTEGNIFFQSIGNGDQGQDLMLSDYVIEQGSEPNLDRRTITFRITELPSGNAVMVDAKYDNGSYKRISSYYDLTTTNSPAGNIAGDSDVLAVVGNFSGSGAIQFEMFQMMLTDEDPSPNGTGAIDPVASRSSSSDVVSSGQSVQITIQVFNPSKDAQKTVVMETIPQGWSASGASNNGVISASTIQWSMDFPSGITNLTYTLTAPTDISTPVFSGTAGTSNIGGINQLTVKKGFAPAKTEWQPPADGWDYIYDPDQGSPENIALDGWAHNNDSDQYAFQPVIAAGSRAGEVWKNPGFIDDGMGGKALRIDDPGDPTSASAYGPTPDPSDRKITLNYNLGAVKKAVAAFRVRSLPHTDQFGTEIPFGYPDSDQYNLLGLVLNTSMQDLTNWDELSSSGLYFSPDFPDSLNFPNFGGQVDQYILGKYDANWDNSVWHEYWITYNVSDGEKATALYTDGSLTAKFSFPLKADDLDYYDDETFLDAQKRGAFFNRSHEADAGIPTGNLVFRITFRNTSDAGTLDFDYIALKAGTDEAPKKYVEVDNWYLY